MPHPQLPPELVEAAEAIGTALVPASIGAAVSQAFKRGLSMAERLIQMVVGICVSWFVTRATAAMFDPDPLVVQAIGFVIAMIAYEATPRFIQNMVDVVASLPGEVKDRLLGLLARKADK